MNWFQNGMSLLLFSCFIPIKDTIYALSYSETRKAVNWEDKQEGVPDNKGNPWTGQEMEQLSWAYAKNLQLLFPLKAISIMG